MAKQSETKKCAGQTLGKHDYNPVNMSGQKAGIVEEVEERAEAECENTGDTSAERKNSQMPEG